MFDTDTFETITAGDTDIAREITELFREDSAALLDKLTAAVEGRQDDEVRRIAHTLKSSAGSLGATKASKLAATIEEQGMAAAVELLQPLVQSVQDAITCMDEHLARAGR